MAVQTPYLDAIQGIPGDTPGEKFLWIAKLTKDRLRECNSLEEVAEVEKIPKPLAPLVQVQAALMLNKKDKTNRESYEAIAEALKSNDEMVTNKAFESSSFFDGTNKAITSVQYYFENLFPFVSLNTRTRIIKALANHLARKDSDLAECFFVAVTMTYGLQQALPLLLACSESFMYNTILEKRIVLSRKQIKDIFRRNPDFVVRYFRLSKCNTDPYQRNLHCVNVSEYGDFLAALIKKRLEAFVELYEMHMDSPPRVSLSNKCAESFLKNGKEHLQRNPKLYIDILPLKLISASRMENIFAKLFPENVKNFNTDQMLRYLEFYPQEKKADLFLKTYRQVYGRNLLESSSNVTHTLLKILPPEERIKQARMKLAEETTPTRTMAYSFCWRCYLPTDESIPYFKDEISKTPVMENRAVILSKMIFCCKVNNDDQTLLDVLKYIRDRHKNEQYWLTLKVFECLQEQYDLPQLSEEYWEVLMDIILRLYVKKELPAGNTISEKMVEAAIHFKIIHNQPTDQVIDILINMKSTRCTIFWNVLRKYPEYERMCLEACLTAISKKFDSEEGPWSQDKPGVLYDLCYSIYHFNEDHVNKYSRIERMSVKNYPWLLEKISELLFSEEEKNNYITLCFKTLLQTNEKDIHDRFWPSKGKKIASLESGEALVLLRKNPESILEQWKEYLDACKTYWHNKQTKRFVKATRWYKDIPVKFVEQCLQDSAKNDGECLGILATLVNGETFVKVIEPLIPTAKTVDVHQKEAKLNYLQIVRMITASKTVNPPLPLPLVGRLLEGDYLSVALIVLTNTCRRTSSMDVIAFARTLSSQRVSVRKHGIRVMSMVASRDQLQQFLLAKWKSEKHYSIREVLFSKAKQLFNDEPDQDTWTMFSKMVSTLKAEDQTAIYDLINMLHRVPNVYVSDFAKLILNTIDRYSEAGFPQNKLITYICSLLESIDAAMCKLLPEDFVEKLLRRFLFHPAVNVSESAVKFTINAYLLPSAKQELDKRMNVFSNIFVETVKTAWNIPHPKKPFFYPVNYKVGKLIGTLTETTYSNATRPELIDGVLKTFLSVLTPQMDPTSYLLLVFAREYASAKNPKELGIRIGRMMPELINAFSHVFVFFMSSVLQTMIGNSRGFMGRDREDDSLAVIEGFTEVGSTEAMLMAVRLLTPVNNHDYSDRYNDLVLKFTECDHPAIKSVICDILNKTYYDCSDSA